MHNAEYSRRDVLKRNIRIFMFAWTAIVAVSLVWTLHYQQKAFEESLHTEAAAMHAIDMG
jgi:hypothetical protein